VGLTIGAGGWSCGCALRQMEERARSVNVNNRLESLIV
jgi:hypothetical protein